MDTVHERSAGGLLVRGKEVLLIALAGGERWQLPKGHVEPGESEEQAAVREVREETGVTGRPLARLPEIEYWFVQAGQRIHKRVAYFLLEYERGSEIDFDPAEVSGAGWFPWDEALGRLTFDNERRVAAAAREAWGRLAEAAHRDCSEDPGSVRDADHG
jgi:8-oxo-dGTP pyrophosphatase MutT (NUDIX family)